MADTGQDALSNKARRYSFLKYLLAIVDTGYLLVFLIVYLATGFSKYLAAALSGSANLFILPLYLLIICIIYYLLSFPLNFYRSYILEHKFYLSKQKLPDWFIDQAKSGIILYAISLVLTVAFYYILRHNPKYWWLTISAFWIFFSLVLAKVAPVAIIPLFFKYKKLNDDSLRLRILSLAERMKVKILDVFEIDFSKKTLKANAAFVGIGKTRRVILADTLKDKYSHDEIEVILAHEFAHYRLKHLIKLIFVNSIVTTIVFYLIFKTNNYTLGLFGFSSLYDIAAMPVVFLYFMLFGIIMQPLEAYISRRFERNADALALKITGLKDPFISLMDKLGNQNLADRRPHPVIKFFFFDHPPIDERINMANMFKDSS